MNGGMGIINEIGLNEIGLNEIGLNEMSLGIKYE